VCNNIYHAYTMHTYIYICAFRSILVCFVLLSQNTTNWVFIMNRNFLAHSSVSWEVHYQGAGSDQGLLSSEGGRTKQEECSLSLCNPILCQSFHESGALTT
jgi:hypothetical protein